MFNEKIKPPLVLTLICIITCGLLVAAHDATYVDTTGVITDQLSSGLTEICGTADGFEMLKNDDGTLKLYDGVTSILSNGTDTVFEITADGYSKGGLHVLVAVDGNGAVSGMTVLSIGETPGLGTKVQDAGFMSQFNGVTAPMTVTASSGEPADSKAVWGSRVEIDAYKSAAAADASDSSGFKLDAVTGATLSSNGMYSAVKTALNAYEEMKGGAE